VPDGRLWLFFLFCFLGKYWNAKMQLYGKRQDIKSGIGTGGTTQYHRCEVKSTKQGMYPDKSFMVFL